MSDCLNAYLLEKSGEEIKSEPLIPLSSAVLMI